MSWELLTAAMLVAESAELLGVWMVWKMAWMRAYCLVARLGDKTVCLSEMSMARMMMVLLRAADLVSHLVARLDALLAAWMARMLVPKSAHSWVARLVEYSVGLSAERMAAVMGR